MKWSLKQGLNNAMRSVDEYKCLYITINEICYSNARDAPESNIELFGHSYLSGMWLSVDLKTNPLNPPKKEEKEGHVF